MVDNDKIKGALLTKTEHEWLIGNIEVSKQYEYRIKSDIRKKLKIFQELELPLIIKCGLTNNLRILSPFTQDLSANPQLPGMNIVQSHNDLEFCAQTREIEVGRKVCELLLTQILGPHSHPRIVGGL